jgi:hypothetical protein
MKKTSKVMAMVLGSLMVLVFAMPAMTDACTCPCNCSEGFHSCPTANGQCGCFPNAVSCNRQTMPGENGQVFLMDNYPNGEIIVNQTMVAEADN